MTRSKAMLVLVAVLLLLVGADLVASRPLDPFAAPAPLALWSGQAVSGGHCAAPAREAAALSKLAMKSVKRSPWIRM